MNVAEPIRRAARLTPALAAIVRADGSTISHAALDRAIDLMAGRALGLGLQAGDIAGLAITGPDESPGLILALALARIGVASAEPSLQAGRMRLCFGTGPGQIPFDASWMSGPVVEPVPGHPDPAAICRIFTSSGTIGTEKHIPVTHAAMTHRVYGGLWLGDRGGPLIRIIGVGLGGSWGFRTVLRTLWAGGTIVLSNPKDAASAIARHGVTSLICAPGSMREVLETLPSGTTPFPSLEVVETGGSLLPDPLYRLAVERLCPNIHCYLGAAETGITASAPMAMLLSRPGAVGYVYPDVRVEAVDADGMSVPPGTEGLLRFRGAGVSTFYLGDEAATRTGFRDGWFWSGDIGAIWPDGAITLGGRANDVINSGGVKVSAETIERALLQLPTVLDAAAFGVPDASGIERVWAAIVARTQIDDTVLAAFCARMLPGKTPDIIVQLKALPRGANGKVRRDMLRDMARELGRRQPEN